MNLDYIYSLWRRVRMDDDSYYKGVSGQEFIIPDEVANAHGNLVGKVVQQRPGDAHCGRVPSDCPLS